MRLASGTLPWPWIDPDKALPWAEKQIGLAFAESQIAAIRLALMAKVLVMTGGHGVGKTTIVRAILGILAAKGIGLLLCAPTGRAAKRMTEATGFEAKTIHRLLEVDPKTGGFRRGEDNPLDCDLLVIDEASHRRQCLRYRVFAQTGNGAGWGDRRSRKACAGAHRDPRCAQNCAL
jgi:exodeoxyribonuclease V alpha subunit